MMWQMTPMISDLLNGAATLTIIFCTGATGMLMYSRVAPEHYEEYAKPVFVQSWQRVEQYRSHWKSSPTNSSESPAPSSE